MSHNQLVFVRHIPSSSWLALAGLALALGQGGQGAEFRAGAAKVDITPTRLPIRTAGNLTLTLVSNVHDRLHVRALVLDDGATGVALAVVDSCMVAREELDQAKAAASQATGMPLEHMLISATHTHTAPAVYGCHGNDPELEYRAWLVPRITEAVVRAWHNRQPARVGWGSLDLATFVHCRRWLMQPGTAQDPNPAFTGCLTNLAMMNPGYGNTNKIRQTGPVDPAVTVLSLQTPDGRPLSLLANYSTHYASAPSQQLSADYFGVFCDLLERQLQAGERNPGFVALMSNGTSGDANCVDFTKPNWVVNPAVVGKAVAAAVTQALEKMTYKDWVPLAAVQEKLQLGVRLPTPGQIEEARAYLSANVGSRPTRNWEENYARETTLLAHWPGTKEILLQAIRVGDLGLGAIPCETYGSTGLALKRASPFSTTMILGLANGYNGYLPPPDQFPFGGYTTWRARSSYLETNAEPRIRQVLTDLLRRARAHRR